MASAARQRRIGGRVHRTEVLRRCAGLAAQARVEVMRNRPSGALAALEAELAAIVLDDGADGGTASVDDQLMPALAYASLTDLWDRLEHPDTAQLHPAPPSLPVAIAALRGVVEKAERTREARLGLTPA